MPSRRALGAPTRLLVLGAVRLFQPVHGYLLRRELETWEIGSWASIHPGSIYQALRTLTERGLLEEGETESHGARPARTVYRLTDRGEEEFFALLRSSLVEVDDTTSFLVATNYAVALTREEAATLFERRAAALDEARVRLAENVERMIADPETPDSATEVLRVGAARIGGELAWCRDYADRIRAGVYSFQGEPPHWRPTEEQVAAVLRAGAQLPPEYRD
jgi:DNA-binding PadR family transcriptional regulator